MIIVCQKPLKKLKINGIALFPFIFIRKPEDKENNILINHEKIHLRQQLEMLIIFFYIFYVIEYYYWFFKLKDGYLAYRRISFEREAYTNEHNLTYLKKENSGTSGNICRKIERLKIERFCRYRTIILLINIRTSISTSIGAGFSPAK